jgi:HTH-type transcriptional regulator/antitoxin HipB
MAASDGLRDPAAGALAAETPVRSVAEIGALVRAYRTRRGLDQATTAGLAGVGVRFLGELERGKPTLRIALVLQVLERLGLEVWIAPRRPIHRQRRDR